MFWRKRILIALAALGWAGAARADSTEVEHARYSVAAAAGGVEIRDYAPEIVAETSVAGEREAAINQGFRTIAGYIFGGNAPGRENRHDGAGNAAGRRRRLEVALRHARRPYAEVAAASERSGGQACGGSLTARLGLKSDRVEFSGLR
jgi:hypothetical protein